MSFDSDRGRAHTEAQKTNGARPARAPRYEAGGWRRPRRERYRVVLAPQHERLAQAAEPAGRKRCRGELGVQIGKPRRHVALAAAVAEHLDAVVPGQPLIQLGSVRDQVVGEESYRHGEA